jgi:hypothetical protein
MRLRVALGSAALVITLGAFLYGQEAQKVPGFGTGVVTVAGTVDIGNTPLVLAHQAGEWKVVLAAPPDVRVVNAPSVSVPTPAFLKSGGRYEITWSTGDRQVIRVIEVASDGWLKVEAAAERWINIASARSVAAAP